MLSLGYYANQISVHFKLESIVTHASLYHLYLVGPDVPIKVQSMIETTEFLLNMFRNEFIPINHQVETEAGVLYMLEQATKHKLIKQIEGGYTSTDDKIA